MTMTGIGKSASAGNAGKSGNGVRENVGSARTANATIICMGNIRK